jgi:tetratricopeptide (TPR) repeat protein
MGVFPGLTPWAKSLAPSGLAIGNSRPLDALSRHPLRGQVRIAEEAERDAANRHWEAEVTADYRARELAENQANLVRNSNKIRARSLTDRAKELYAAELYSEAAETCGDALKEDRGWISAYAIMGASLYEIGKRDEAAEAMLKAIRLLGHGEWKTAKAFNVVLSWIDDRTYPDEVIQELRRKVAENIALADAELMRRFARRGWGQELQNSFPHVTFTYHDACQLLETLLAKDQASVAQTVLMCTLALKESVPVANSYEPWLNLALWAAAIECQVGRAGVLENIIMQAVKCSPEDGLGLLRFLGGNSKFSALDVVRRNAVLGKLAPFSVKWLNVREAAVKEQAKSSFPSPPPLVAWIPSVQASNVSSKNQAAATAAGAYRKEIGPILERSGISRFLEAPNAGLTWNACAPEIVQAEKAWAGEVLFSYASRARTLKDFVKALAAFQGAAERFAEVGDLVAASSCFLKMGWCTCPDRNPQGEWGQADQLFQKAVATAEAAGPDNLNIAAGLWGQGWCAEPANNPQGDWGVSIALYKRAAEAGRRAESDVWESDSLHAVGFCYEPGHASFGDWKMASEWYRRAAAIRSVAKLKLPLANTCFRLAVCLSNGEPSKTTAEAGELFKQAKLLYQEKGDVAGAAKVDSWLESEAVF